MGAEHPTFLCLTAEFWTALWTFFIFAATAALVAVAWYQIGAAREENRKTQTLLACGQYDTSQVMFDCQMALSKARHSPGGLKKHALSLRTEIITVLNFLDAIAIGINQGLYVDDLAKDHLQSIIARHVSDLIDSGVVERLGGSREHWARLCTLRDKWSGG